MPGEVTKSNSKLFEVFHFPHHLMRVCRGQALDLLCSIFRHSFGDLMLFDGFKYHHNLMLLSVLFLVQTLLHTPDLLADYTIST